MALTLKRTYTLRIELLLTAPSQGRSLEASYSILMCDGAILFGRVTATALSPPYLNPSSRIIVSAEGEAWAATTQLILPWENAEAVVAVRPLDDDVTAEVSPPKPTDEGAEYQLSFHGVHRSGWTTHSGFSGGVASTTIDVDVITAFDRKSLRLRFLFKPGLGLRASPRKLMLARNMGGDVRLGLEAGRDATALVFRTEPPGIAVLSYDAVRCRITVEPKPQVERPFDVIVGLGHEQVRIPVIIIDEIR